MHTAPSIFELANATVIRDGMTVFDHFHWTMREGEAWAVVGPTGSGKTTLAEMLLNRHFLRGGTIAWPLLDRMRGSGRRIDYISQAVAHVTFKEDSRLFSYAGRYYQQRFEFADSDSDTPLSLDQFLRTGTHATDAEREAVCARFGLAELIPQPFMTLSNGQTRRARLARAMLTHPELLILDDPFIGLDSVARADLAAMLGDLVREGKRVVLICREDAVPKWVTNTLVLSKDPTPQPPPPGGEGEPEALLESKEASTFSNSFSPSPPGGGGWGVGFSPIIELRDVTITHSGHTILDRVSWTVRAGERWAVLGPNGSGKSTLLSLLCGDHPQAYSNDVQLFGRRRGSGETIWDVKRNVGLLSPEFHLYFSEPLSAEHAAATGFFDTLARKPTSREQDARVKELFAAFGITHLAARAFKSLSTGEQRLVLLARALVKRPPLVILDEPFQGMDAANTARCRDWLDRELDADQTLLFVTHEPSELPCGVSKTLRLEKGRVVSN
jgi:molybdate transport system ATP-binding protein